MRTYYMMVAILTVASAATTGLCDEPTPSELFNQRIMPIFQSPQPSSCVQCHLSSVDLKNYILPSSEKTFVSLRDQGLVDLENPADSKILTLIRMGDKDQDEAARLIHENMRRAEYTAFAEWIKACCDDPNLRDLAALSLAELARPPRSDEVIRHTRKSRVMDSFVRNVWSQRMRCFPCHTPHEIDAENPRHQAAVKTRKEFKEKYGDQFAERLDIFRETPEATLSHLVELSRKTAEGDYPLINLDDPRHSLLVLKPMSKLPAKREDGTFEPASSSEPVSHMGGLKLHRDDQSYKSFVAWLQDYANVVHGRYVSVEDLPADNWHGSSLVLKLTAAPEEWPVGMPVQMFVHPWNAESDSWTEQPVAFTQSTVTPRRIVVGSLFLLAANGDNPLAQENNTLETGKYLVKVYLDQHNRVAQDPTLLLGEDDFVGQVELRKARWREGFKHAESIAGNRLVE